VSDVNPVFLPAPVSAEPVPAPTVTEAGVLALVDRGRVELEAAVRTGDPAAVADVVRRADAIRYLSKKAGLALEAINAGAQLKTDAEIRAGTMLREMDRARGRPGKASPPVTLSDLDIERMQAHRWQDMSRVEEAEPGWVANYYKTQAEKQSEITSSAIAHKGARLRRLEQIAEKQGSYEATAPDERPVSVVYADPPWQYEFAVSDSRKIENQYPTMTVEKIAAEDPAPAEDAVLFLWVTSPKLPEGLQIMEAWGFRYRTSMVWVKAQIGMGYYARGQHELLLIGALGSLPAPEPEVRPPSVIDSRRAEHSAKPDLRPLLDTMYPDLLKREMFSRRPADGLWLVHGNQCQAEAAS
jgi:N6-adenosine-specific RNA methylase IME4